MNRKTGIAICLLCAVPVMQGCGKEDLRRFFTGRSYEDIYRIAFSCSDLQDSYQSGVEKRLRELCGNDPSVELVVADAAGDAAAQAAQLQKFAEEGVDCAVIAPLDAEMPEIGDCILDWNDDGVPVFCISQCPEEGHYTYVGDTDFSMGIYECFWAREHLPEKARILYLDGPEESERMTDRKQSVLVGFSGILFNDWYNNIVNEDGTVKVLSWRRCDNSFTGGKEVMTDWIALYDRVDAVIAACDQSALGAAEALEEAGIRDCLVCSMGGSEEGIQAVREGVLSVTVGRDSISEAETLYGAVKNAQIREENPEMLFPNVKIIDQTNAAEFLREDSAGGTTE